jgi:multimeric flavodoxin WrbA
VEKTLKECGIETEIFWIGNKPIGGCIACKGCIKLGKCAYDDVVNVAREKSYEADGFIFGTPVHYAAPSGNMTAFMDRLFYSEACGNGAKAFYLKPAAAITVARRGGTTAAFDQMNKYFTISQMPIVSSKYWNMVHGAKAVETYEDEEGMLTMRILGRNMAYMLKCLKAGRDAGVELPAIEPHVFTNFINKKPQK